MEIERQKLFLENWQKSEMIISQDGYVVTDETWRQEPLPTPISRLYYVLEGEGMLLSDTQSMKLEAGHVYLAPCGARCGYYGCDSVTKLFFHINVMRPDGYDLFSGCRNLMCMQRSPEEIRKILSWYLSDDMGEQMMLLGEIWKTVAGFAKQFLSDTPHTGEHGDIVKRAIEYIQKNLQASLTVQQVATGVFCSVSRLGENFRREMGVTVAQYIEDLVMFQAQKRLVFSEKTVGEISAELGFCDQFYFSRRFQRRYLISPREYRKMHAKT